MMSDKVGPVAILAGAGRLPAEIINTLEAQGRPYHIIALRGFADKDIARRADTLANLLDVRGIISCLEQWNPESVVLAGAVQRPKPSVLLGSYSLVRNVNELRAIVARGDDHLLRGAIAVLEDKGFKVIGAHEISPNIMSGQGVLSKREPSASEYASISSAIALLNTLASFDIGQGLVVSGQRILAIEGPEGTDKMLRRVASFQKKKFFSRLPTSPSDSIFVKTAKLNQDLRVDMPVIGPRTIKEAARAGLCGIALGSGKTLIINQEETIYEADRHGLFLVGVPVH